MQCFKLFLGLRLLGIGRNEYIDLINQSRSNKARLFGKKNVRVLLPQVPVNIHMEPWWRVEVGLVLEEDVKVSYLSAFSAILPFKLHSSRNFQASVSVISVKLYLIMQNHHEIVSKVRMF